ncbi:MAG: hypothetical protein IH583_03120 [Candidatus Aminicenantes bacterium]|nr:hypothetical protein [Candidatus Aminicenantes bacterium]
MKKQSIRIPGTGRIYKRGAVWYLDYWIDGCRKQEKGSGSKEEALRILAARRADAERGEVGFEKKQAVHFSSPISLTNTWRSRLLARSPSALSAALVLMSAA